MSVSFVRTSEDRKKGETRFVRSLLYLYLLLYGICISWYMGYSSFVTVSVSPGMWDFPHFFVFFHFERTSI